jgi:DNA-binding SARP family transcriptional activator
MSMGNAAAKATGGRLSVRLFGAAQFEASGEPVKFSKRNRTIALLAKIILQRGAPLARDTLAFTVFPDDDEAAALSQLRRYLYLATKALPPPPDGTPWLTADGETVRWNLAACASIDVLEFETCAAAPEHYERAFELYAGDLLEDLYDDWIVVERERLRARYLHMLGDALERYRSDRRFAQAIAGANRILANDPWREDTLRALVSLRHESGDSAGALAEFDRFARRLRDEMAIAPMPETVALRNLILRGETPAGAVRVARSQRDDAPRRDAILPFVGRGREMVDARAVWTRAARGCASLLVVEGEAGAGKSRFAAELARLAQSEGGRTFAGSTAVPEAMPYQALVEALRAATPLLLARPPNDARRALLARLLPELRDPDRDADRLPDDDAERGIARFHDAFADAVRRLASGRPLLLILEDLHWAGDATLDALASLIRELHRSPVLVVATCRGEETPPGHHLRAVARDLATAGLANELFLPRLSEEAIGELVDRVDGLHGRPASFARELFARSEGNALFVNEFVSGTLEGSESAESTIAALIATRLARLSDRALDVAHVAAIAGMGCDASLVRDVSNLSSTDVALGFDELLDKRILREAGARARHDYVFTHHLIADAAYADVAPDVRARRHARIARLLEAERSRTDGLEREIARHYDAADEREAAARWYARAAASAARVHAYADTIALATRGLALGPGDAWRRTLLETRESAYALRGERAAQRADVDALQRLAGDDPQQAFDVLRRRIALARALGDSDEEGTLIAQLTAFEAHLGDAAKAEGLLQSATHAIQQSRPLDARAAASGALELFEKDGNVRSQLECLSILVDAAANAGDLAASNAYLAQIHVRAADAGENTVEQRALTTAAKAALLRYDYRTSHDLSVRALAIAEATGDRDAVAATLGRLGAVNAWLGSYAAALRDFERALETYASIGNKRGLAVTHTNRTMLLMRLGLFDDALESIARSKELFATVGERRTMVANLVNESFVRVQQGDAAGGRARAFEALALARDIGFPIFEAAALANIGNAERALGNFTAAIDAMERGIAIRRPLQEPRDFADDLSDLALGYAQAGRGADAGAVADDLSAIDGGVFTSALWPHYVRWAISVGHAAGGRPAEAADGAARARTELYAFAAAIDDDRARRAFLAIPVNVEIARDAAI